ncbi:hypothetical protein CAEBREN_20033 [Caenorhabditis brenneri]|uniref:Homeobox domain-containing protein n=1 Tax=Caenorhabditis brenneri TaxID=135651 RepID=G0NF53_CAEBE|nr:hypothetical protein CAEBREN_20033 [Caenorhabditis brenneri]
MDQNVSACNDSLSMSVSPSSGISSSTTAQPSSSTSPEAGHAHLYIPAPLIELGVSNPALLCYLLSGNPSDLETVNNAPNVNRCPHLNHTLHPNASDGLLRSRSPTPSPVPSDLNSESPSKQAALIELYKTLSGAFDSPVLNTSTTTVPTEIVPEFPLNSKNYNHFKNYSPSAGNGWRREWIKMAPSKSSRMNPSREEPDFNVRFQPFQVEALKEKWKTTKYLTKEDRKQLELKTGLNKNQILDWFSYRRNKGKMGSTDEKRPNVRFTAEQKGVLRSHFIPGQYISMSKRMMLAAQIGLSPEQVKGWFSKQNQNLRLAEERKRNREKEEEQSNINS